MDKPARRYLFDPEQMTSEERLARLVEILGRGLLDLIEDDWRRETVRTNPAENPLEVKPPSKVPSLTDGQPTQERRD